MNERKKCTALFALLALWWVKVQKVQKVQGKKMTWDSWDSETVEWGVIPFKQGKVSSVSRVSCNFLYYRHPMPGNGRRMKKTRDTIPRNYQERKTWERKSCLLGGGAGRSSSDRLSYRVIEKANLNRPCMVDAISPPVPWGYIPSPLLPRNVSARSAELLSLETGLIRDDSGNG